MSEDCPFKVGDLVIIKEQGWTMSGPATATYSGPFTVTAVKKRPKRIYINSKYWQEWPWSGYDGKMSLVASTPELVALSHLSINWNRLRSLCRTVADAKSIMGDADSIKEAIAALLSIGVGHEDRKA